MNLVNDYFLLYHGINYQSLKSHDIKIELNYKSLDIVTLILIISKDEFLKIEALKSYDLVFKKLNISKITNMDELYIYQKYIVDLISKTNCFGNIPALHKNFLFLKDNDIISYAKYKKLISLFEEKDTNTIVQTNKKKNTLSNFSFMQEKNNLINIINDLENKIDNKIIKQHLFNTKEYIKEQIFSIGITGVMNAGKSTMLNALLKEELLGTSVVPETANLTIVKYNKEKSAKVFYWNQKQWNNILSSALEIQEMQEYINETSEIYKDSIHEYIKDISRSDEIDVKDLSLYTSAKQSNKKCNLIQHVELFSDLNFLQNNVQIVDTPGLDDIVVQREEITKEYINKCDMMIHLMNVSQSATQKDIEFIIDALLYQNVSKLLIVITRKDTVNQKDLNAVIKYTKTSIKKALIEQNKEDKLSFILHNISFIAISAKMALEIRTNKDVIISDDFNMQKSGLVELEEYLDDNLFGKNALRSKLIIQSTQKQIIDVINKQKDALSLSLQASLKTQSQLENELEIFNIKKKKNEDVLKLIKEDINYSKNSANEYVNILNSFLDNELDQLYLRLKQRITSDVRYSYEKTKEAPNPQRIKTIIQTTIKDSIIDIIRDYNYKFVKKLKSINEQYNLKFKYINKDFFTQEEIFDIDTLLTNDFKNNLIIPNNETLINMILKNLNESKKNKLDEFDLNVTKSLDREFIHISSDLKEKTNTQNSTLIKKFFELLNLSISSFQEKINLHEDTLNKYLKNVNLSKDDSSDLNINIHNNIKYLDSIVTLIQSNNNDK